MEKLLISLLAAIGIFLITMLPICAFCGKLSVNFDWYIWVANVLFIGFSWIFVWCRMNA